MCLSTLNPHSIRPVYSLPFKNKTKVSPGTQNTRAGYLVWTTLMRTLGLEEGQI